jgi:hypothetical protein
MVGANKGLVVQEEELKGVKFPKSTAERSMHVGGQTDFCRSLLWPQRAEGTQQKDVILVMLVRYRGDDGLRCREGAY